MLEILDTWIFELRRTGKTVNIFMKDNSVSTFSNALGWKFNCADLQYNLYVYLFDNLVQHVTDAVDFWGLNWSMCNQSNVHINLLSNPLQYDCVFFDYQRSNLFREKGWLFTMANYFPPDTSQICYVTDKCPPECRCIDQPATSKFIIDCSAARLHNVPVVVPPLPRSYVKYAVNISGNPELRTLTNRPYFSKTLEFDASNSGLESIDSDAMEQLLSSATVVRLDGNRLARLPLISSSAAELATTRFNVVNNPWQCSCDNRVTIGWLKSIESRLSDADKIICDSPSTMNNKNLLKLTDDDLCADPVSQTMRIAIAASVSSFVVFLATATIVYFTVRRFRCALFARFRLHPFDRDECIGEDMKYDVFLCCSEDDVRPHGNRILDLLESNGYSVCFEPRDFTLGQLLSASVSHAIENSKRTVCLVSESFIMW